MKKVIVVLCLIFMLIAPISISASAKEYFIDRLNIEAEILTNGDVVVNEIMEYRFSGDFNGVYRNFQLNETEDYNINSISIIDSNGNITEAYEGYNEENNTYEISEEYDNINIKLFTKSSNENKSININYTIKGAAKKYTDFSELYWNFYNVENVDYVGEGSLKVYLKEGSFNEEDFTYEVFGDGDIRAEASENSINIDFKNLTSLIGIKVNFQKDYLSMIEESSIDYYDDLEYEEYFGNYNDNTKDIEGISVVIFLAFISGVAVISIYFGNKAKFQAELKKYREKAIVSNADFILEPPSNLPPALVNLLYNEKIVSNEMVYITLFYLVNEGYYTIEEKILENKKKDKDLIFTRTDKINTLAYEHINFILQWFSEYELNHSFTLQEIKKLVKSDKNARQFIENMNHWKETVLKDGKNLGFFITIRNKQVLENSWYSERRNWISYKNYLKNININCQIENNLQETNIIYGSALELNIDDLKNVIDLVMPKGKSNNNFYGNNNYWYYDNYLIYYNIFNVIRNDADNIVNPPMNSSTFGGDATFSSGGDFSGGGGGDSGAF